MRRIYILSYILFVCIGITAQTTDEVIQKMQEIRQEQGDSLARDYLAKNQSVFTANDANPTYLVLWGLLTSYMWNANPHDELTKEYKEYLDAVIDEEIKSEAYSPDENSISSLWQLTNDYSRILYAHGELDNACLILSRMHKWFEPYSNLRYTVGYAQSLLNYCLILVRDMHKYKEGEPIAEEYLDVSKKVYGEQSAQYALAIYNMHIFPNKSISEKAEIIKQAISIYETAEYQDPAMLEQMKDTYKAQMVNITGITNTDNDIITHNGIISLASCMSLVTAERGAEALESLMYYKNQLASKQYLDTLQYSNVITLIIGTYIQKNDLAAAQKEIEDFNDKVGIDNLPLNHAQVFYSSAGLVAMRLKDYPKALRYAHAACRLSEKISAPDIEYCKVLGNISIMYAEAASVVDKQFYLDAKWYIDEAISVFEEKIGPLAEHGSTGLTLLNNKAFVYDALGDRQGSIDVYEKIVSGFADNNDVKSSWALAANNLSVLYIKTGQVQKAVDLLESLSSANKEYEMLFKQNLALAYYVKGDDKMKKTFQEYNQICYSNCMDVFSFFTPAEREDYWTGTARELLTLNNLSADKYPDMTDVGYNNLLFIKNLKLMSSDILKSIVENSSDVELKKKYDRVLSLRDAIAYQSNQSDSIAIWQNELRGQERSILGMIPDYKDKLLSSFRTWDEIKNVLQDDEVAIEFTYIPKITGWEEDDATGFYGAYVLANNLQRPELVTLCEVDAINHYFTGKTNALQISSLYKDSISIYNSIWGKLEQYIKGKRTIYFTPTGQLNLLNHEALAMPDGGTFGDMYDLVRLSSTAKILAMSSKNANSTQYNSASVYGGIVYDLSVAEMNEAAKNYKHNSNEGNLLAIRSEDERGQWNYLQGTEIESEDIYRLLKTYNISATLLQGGRANEESFKSLSGQSPSIIHLSTHGFFLDTTEKERANPFMNTIGSYSEKEDKLIRTGLLLAGANNVWCGRSQVKGIEDGILTADEISRLDLGRTKLVVLSACETAKGQIDEIDGVLGLQRGFKKAGVGSIVMSLWKVSDAVTSILMTQFYTHLAKGMSLRDSLKQATRVVKEKYPDPYYWASFVMLD